MIGGTTSVTGGTTTVIGGSTVTSPATTTVIGGTTITNPDVVNTTTTQGNPALIFAKSTACFAIDLQGANSQFGGAVVSNGGVDAHSSGIGGDTLVWSTNAPNNCKYVNDPLWDQILRQAPTDWPVPPPTCTPACNPTNAAAQVQVTAVNGVPCTAVAGELDDQQCPGARALLREELDRRAE